MNKPCSTTIRRVFSKNFYLISLVIGALEFTLTTLQYLIFVITADRQVSRIRTKLFQSLLQQVFISYKEKHR